MPGLNGHEVLGKVKADEAPRDTPVVFLTGRTGSDEMVAGLRAGAQDYLKKPFEPRRGTGAVRESRRQARGQREPLSVRHRPLQADQRHLV